MFDTINSVDHITKTERDLEEMKLIIKDKKRLQKERNVLTAQLSRDRKKLEVELLRQSCHEMATIMNKARNVLSRPENGELAKQMQFLFDRNSEIYKMNSGVKASSFEHTHI